PDAREPWRHSGDRRRPRAGSSLLEPDRRDRATSRISVPGCALARGSAGRPGRPARSGHAGSHRVGAGPGGRLAGDRGLRPTGPGARLDDARPVEDDEAPPRPVRSGRDPRAAHRRATRDPARLRRGRERRAARRGRGVHVRGGAGMDAEAFVRDLDARNQELLRRLAPESTLKPEVEGDLTVLNLLKVALKNEIEATETAARWLATTTELDVKLALARQVGDEAKHYRLVADRLQELGFDVGPFDPLAKGYGPLFQFLDSL